MKKSIKSKIVIFVLLIIILVVSTQIIFNLFFAKPYFSNQKKVMIDKLFKDIRNNYSDDENQIYSIVNKYEEVEKLRIIVFNDKSDVIYDNSGRHIIPWENTNFYFSNDENRLIFSKDPIVKVQQSYRTHKDSITLYGIIDLDEEKRYIVIETPVSVIDQSVKVLTQFTIYISIFELILGGIAAYIFADKFTKPVKQIDEIAKNVADLDFSKKADETSSDDEIGRLARNINIMSSRLSGMITKLKNANEALQKDVDYQKQIDCMRKEFIANVSHELKTPLSLLIGYTEMLRSDIEGIDKNFYYDVIIDESQKMNELVKSLLDISSMENGLKKINSEIIDLGEFTTWLLSKNDILFNKKGVNYKKDLEQNCFVKADKFYIEQVMKNYITNAISHTKSNDNIIITVKNEKDKVVFSVFNEGDNIKSDIINKIWDIFYKSDEARTRNDDTNAGLGLYIVRTIINAHEGEYGVINREDGVEFLFSLKRI